ncbi:MAG: CPBP family intramembrane metalloprotease domain-containing protein, partial [Nonomuraea sp.]|nr:CPBP family intramembrane metalloprotease domain-containing protein [Nonomuraea sp.]
MSELIRRRPLAAFFVLAFLGSWIGWSPWWLSGPLGYRLPVSAVAGINQLGLFAGPFAAALIVTRVSDGREALRAFLRRIVAWRVHPGWYALAVVVVPVAAGAGYLLGGVQSVPVAGLVSTYLVYL